MSLKRLRRGLVLLAAGMAACALSQPIVTTQVVATQPGLLKKVAVVPFEPAPGFRAGAGATAPSGALAAELVTRFVAESLTAHGIAVVAPNDLVIAFEGEGKVLPRGDVAAVSELAARHFGATAIVTGNVQRYREREGGATGAFAPASVAFDLTLHAAPAGAPIYRARFDHTQSTLSGDLFGAIRYPGRGSRWLTAAELARWGADNAIEEMPSGLR
jgi:hypothetical protein